MDVSVRVVNPNEDRRVWFPSKTSIKIKRLINGTPDILLIDFQNYKSGITYNSGDRNTKDIWRITDKYDDFQFHRNQGTSYPRGQGINATGTLPESDSDYPYYLWTNWSENETETDEAHTRSIVFPLAENIWEFQDRVQPHLTACAKALEQANLEAIAHLQALSADICRDIPLVNGETHPVVQRHANTANMCKLLIGYTQQKLDGVVYGTGTDTPEARAEVEALMTKVCEVITNQASVEEHFNRHDVTVYKQVFDNGQVVLPGALNQPGEVIYDIHAQAHNMMDDPQNAGEKVLDPVKAKAEFHALSVTHYTTASRHHKTDLVTERLVNLDTRSDNTDLTITAKQPDDTALTVVKDDTPAGTVSAPKTIKITVPAGVHRIKVALSLHSAASLYVRIAGNILNEEAGREFDMFTTPGLMPITRHLLVVAENGSSTSWDLILENPPASE